ncbi:5'-3' exonuclease (plasmid) [Paenibacillus thiaminolyticus]|uniref:5'-3' exonuclease n=1 Tax=Paenibacillus thiaminolyticus TaxID=49283 RepID=UPI00232BBAEB|nr:5'-3' exonuclease H3TH domain-containing protein [Paenibacillus thiaminolyticus]WCF11477.1 5'-3' exonuclease [Paenibacillus thiaminolyticus]
MDKLLLVDGSSLLTTSFFGTAPLEYQKAKTEEEIIEAKSKLMQVNGVYTNGVYAMVDKLMKIIKHQSPTHLAVAWDISRDTFRREIFPAYKANRSETRAELKSQFPLAQEVLCEMGIPQFLCPGYEADDIIGTFSKSFESQVPVYILTKDRDALQLVSERVRLWLMTSKAEEMYKEVGLNSKDFNLPDKVFEFSPHYVEEFCGVKPVQIIDKKALEGDKSDNIPGVKGVGEASAVPLLREFETVEGIYEFVEQSDEVTVKEVIKSLGIKRSPVKLLLKHSENELVGKQAAFISKKLATIRADLDLIEQVMLKSTTPIKMNELKLENLKLHINEEGKRRIFERLSFDSLLKKSA